MNYLSRLLPPTSTFALGIGKSKRGTSTTPSSIDTPINLENNELSDSQNRRLSANMKQQKEILSQLNSVSSAFTSFTSDFKTFTSNCTSTPIPITATNTNTNDTNDNNLLISKNITSNKRNHDSTYAINELIKIRNSKFYEELSEEHRIKMIRKIGVYTNQLLNDIESEDDY